MSFYKFGKKDILRNRIKAYPNNTFFVYSGSVYYNNRNYITGAYVNNVGHVDTGFLSLYELNIDRRFSDHTYEPNADTGVKAKIFPFITKDSSLNSFGTVSTTNFNQFAYGHVMTGTYPMSASIIRSGSEEDEPRARITALQNTLNYYKTLSPHYAYSSSVVPGCEKASQALSLISIPSIFYGSSMRKNSVKLNFYLSGTLVASCEDLYRNGELIQTSGTAYAQSKGSGSVAGVVLYNEGFVILTGSWPLTEETLDFGAASNKQGTWFDFAVGANDGADMVQPSASFSLSFQGINYIDTITMFADAPLGELNFSPNPTYTEHTGTFIGSATTSGSAGYFENNRRQLKNTISSSFYNYDAEFKRQTFISKIGIYDENKNLIAVANLSKPVKKLEDRDFTFKLKLDI